MPERKMLIESDPHETRIAVLEEDRLAELHLERRHHRGVVGNVYKGRVSRVLPGMQAAFVDIGLERDAFLYVADVYVTVPGQGLGGDDEIDLVAGAGDEDATPLASADSPTIDSLLKVGQELLVQVTKDPLPNKGARVTTQITLPGRFVVYLPTVVHVGVSRKIEDEEERTVRLLLEEALAADDPAGAGRSGGVIVRTAERA
ncbi:MAG: ribonuclease E/G [Thermoanaerobaculia bacterium]